MRARWFELDDVDVFGGFLMKSPDQMKAAWRMFKALCPYERKRRFADMLFEAGCMRNDAWLARALARELAKNGSYEDLFDVFMIMNDFAVTKKDKALRDHSAKMVIKIGTSEQIAMVALFAAEPYCGRANRRLIQQGATWEKISLGVENYLMDFDRDPDSYEEEIHRIFF